MAARKAKKPILAVEDHNMTIFAFRYALGRMSSAPSTCAGWLIRNWSSLSENTRHIIARDLEDEFARDDEARLRERETGTSDHAKPLGHDCDRREWSRVRSLYRTPTCCKCGTELSKQTPQTLHVDGERSCQKCVPFECENCGKPFRQLENFISDPVTRRSRHAIKCSRSEP